jgi:hypothetical protein
MANYIKSTDFAVKDGLTTGDPNKIIKGTEINTEFNDISTAIASKADTNSPVFTGNPTAPTQSVGNNSTRIATTAFVATTLNAVQSNVNITGGDIDNVDITGGTITGLATDLAVADGGTGRSSLTSNNVVLGNGTNAVNFVAPGTSGNVLTSNGTTWASQARPLSLGENQSWQDVTSSRTFDTTYTNSTGRAIVVQIFIDNFTSDLPGLRLFAGGILICRSDAGTGTSGVFVTGIIPDGTSYSSTRSFSSIGTATWLELR